MHVACRMLHIVRFDQFSIGKSLPSPSSSATSRSQIMSSQTSRRNKKRVLRWSHIPLSSPVTAFGEVFQSCKIGSRMLHGTALVQEGSYRRLAEG